LTSSCSTSSRFWWRSSRCLFVGNIPLATIVVFYSIYMWRVYRACTCTGHLAHTCLTAVT
jgi:hypothetical protein